LLLPALFFKPLPLLLALFTPLLPALRAKPLALPPPLLARVTRLRVELRKRDGGLLGIRSGVRGAHEKEKERKGEGQDAETGESLLGHGFTLLIGCGRGRCINGTMPREGRNCLFKRNRRGGATRPVPGDLPDAGRGGIQVRRIQRA